MVVETRQASVTPTADNGVKFLLRIARYKNRAYNLCLETRNSKLETRNSKLEPRTSQSFYRQIYIRLQVTFINFMDEVEVMKEAREVSDFFAALHQPFPV